MRKFLIDISKYGITGVKRLKDRNGKIKYSEYFFDKGISLLKEIKVNPILIPKNDKCSKMIENPFVFLYEQIA